MNFPISIRDIQKLVGEKIDTAEELLQRSPGSCTKELTQLRTEIARLREYLQACNSQSANSAN